MRSRIILGAALAAACSAPQPAQVSYRLVLANGDSLPYVLRSDAETGCRDVLAGGAIVFEGAGGYSASYDIQRFCADSAALPLPSPGVSGRVEVARDTAFFADSLGRVNGFGLLTADSLIVRSPAHRLVYHRD